MLYMQETKVPQETLQVYVSNNISWKDVDPSITQAAAAVMVRWLPTCTVTRFLKLNEHCWSVDPLSSPQGQLARESPD